MSTPPGLRRAALCIPAAALLAAGSAPAQPIERPSDVPLELPPFERPPAELEILPPIRPPDDAEVNRLSAGRGVLVRDYRITGSTVFSEEVLREVVALYTDREITSEDLVSVRNALTRFYVDHGYVNSGAVVPDQSVEDGVVEVRIVEGSLAGIEVGGNRHFRAERLRERIARGAGTPLDLRELEERLQILQQDPLIERVNASLVPGERPGEAILRVRVEEASPYRAFVETSNYEPPSVGAFGASVGLGHGNLLGLGDALASRFDITEGLRKVRGSYAIPVSARGTQVVISGEYSEFDIVEAPFDALDIETRYQSYRIGIRHPFYVSPRTSVFAGILGDWRRTKTTVMGIPFDIPGSSAEDGRTTVAVLRFVGEWLRRERNQVFAARSTLSWGLDVLGATEHSGDVPDGQYVAWLGQFQWARRFERWGVEAIFRTDLQLSNDPLLSLEQIAVGGYTSVRGYRQNQVVRDRAVVSSLELRLPVWGREGGWPVVALAPFFDVGHAFDHSRPGPDTDAKTLSSAGIGLRISFNRFLDGQIYWGAQFDDFDTSGDLQDDGVQFRLTLAL